MTILNGIEDAPVIDDWCFLNFSVDDEKSKHSNNGGVSDYSAPLELANQKTTSFGPQTHQNDSFPETMEDLEWLMDKDAFPTVESCFGILSDDSEFMSDHLSPISVLETSGNSTITNTHDNNLMAPPTNYPKGPRSKKRIRKTVGFGKLPSQRCLWSNRAESEISGRRCQHCLVDKTPQWRAGPMGPKTLCNACGVRYKSGRLHAEYRPACSPTFSSLVHSNSHRKVMEMRMKKQDGIW